VGLNFLPSFWNQHLDPFVTNYLGVLKKFSEALKQAKNNLILGQQDKKSSTESTDIF
jgi:hypothetical protein